MLHWLRTKLRCALINCAAWLRVRRYPPLDAARGAFRQGYPDHRFESANVLWIDGSLWYVYCFHQPPPPTRVEPSPYVVFCVEAGTGAVRQVDLDTEPEYRLRGRK